ncbi:N-6 DNA methylase [Mycobacteroides abscessus subsp. bolletii]|uniref:HsdM family class I SAM-dependent methyltransferase n=1 Tax=Mycobacteroides abscessus TaxID=36809 RepID=UPI0009A7676E|nr:N-6 DNA methylase [Mycobacteroides abscessus]SLI42264.1 N-6 DNA methylase [Mycobacteroides abscessus subsp. bolletii]
MANERITEDAVDSILRELGYYDDEDRVAVEKQQSTVAAIRLALSKASKTGKGGVGRPEFIITSQDATDMVMIVECKAKLSQHESKNRDRPAEFAVDGVLHYARALSPTYTVIAVAVSGGGSSQLKVDNFLVTKGTSEARSLIAPTGAAVTDIVSLVDYINAASFDPAVQEKRTHDLIAFSQELHVFMRDEAELEEKEKPLLVAGTLIALRNEVFAKTYDAYSAGELSAFWMDSINKEVGKARLPIAKVANMTQPFTSIEVHPELSKPTKGYPKGLLNQTVNILADQVLPFLTIYHDFDVVGTFYGEFLKYTGGDGKGLGIVLTPKHITELFTLLANITKDDVVADICAGTGGFLISAMARMTSQATTNAELENIRRKQLVGVEQQATMYALAASNMILRGDGKANLHQGSCFDTAITSAVRKHKATVGLINPPYSKSKADLHELRFVEHLLDSLVKGGRCVAIVPVSCATAPSVHKESLLKKHTLEAVMSMPPELFHPVGVVTCIMVFTAGIPHAISARKTWFGYWRNDGFVKTKHLGRIDQAGRWPEIRDRWVSTFRNREVHAGESVATIVGPNDEWVAEAYMETDYTKLTKEDFERSVLEYALFLLKQNGLGGREVVADAD